MARHTEYQDELPQEDWTKKGRPLRNNQGNRTGNLSIEASHHMENPPRFSRNFTKAIQRNRRLWSKLSKTTTRSCQRRRSVQSGTNLETLKTRMGISILRGMERISHIGSIMGT